MRGLAAMIGLGSLSASLWAFYGCTSSHLYGSYIEEFFPAKVNTLPNKVAIDQALRLCSLTQGEQPFHLKLEVSPPPHSPDKFAEVEIFWLNAITYRTVIRSRDFSQIRIVNGKVIEEHDSGSFYPRWIQNFVDAILDPAPHSANLRNVAGEIPIEPLSQGCIASPDRAGGRLGLPGEGPQICLAGPEPKITAGRDFTRYVAFDDFQPFGSQQIARTLVNDLPENTLVRARVTLLEPLRQEEYAQLKAREYTLPDHQIQTVLVPGSVAESLLDSAPGSSGFSPAADTPAAGPKDDAVVYIRTDRSGKVREAYRDNSNRLEVRTPYSDEAVARALTLKFDPLLVNGSPAQMEATLDVR